jgi:hypothetical protein
MMVNPCDHVVGPFQRPVIVLKKPAKAIGQFLATGAVSMMLICIAN